MQLLIFYSSATTVAVLGEAHNESLLAEFGGLKWTLSYLAASQPSGSRHFRAQFLTEFWWAQMDSDHRPHAYQACALTS